MSDDENSQAQFEQTWQKVPQEERRELLARSQAKALEVCLIVAIFGCTAAFGLSMPWILLGVAVLLPVLFQVVVARMWIEIKPQTVARYFVAIRTAMRYAAPLSASNPTLKTIFRGTVQPIGAANSGIDPEFAADYAEETPTHATLPREVWICLFPEALVMFSENRGGAKLEFIHSILEDFSAVLETPEDLNGAPLPSRLFIEVSDDIHTHSKWLVTSPHPSCLSTCERKIRFLIHRAQATQESLPKPTQDSDSLFASRQLGGNLEHVSN
jgi:hypothetical protein